MPITLLIGIAALDRAQADQWSWVGVLAGIASWFDRSGLLLIGVLSIMAMRSDASARRYLQFAAIPTSVGLIISLNISHDSLSFTPLEAITLVPLLIAAFFGLRRIDRSDAAFIAWGALDTLARVVILKQPPSPILLPGLILLALPILKPALLVLNTTFLILAFSTQPQIQTVFYTLRSLSAVQPVSIPYSADLTLIGVAAPTGVQVRNVLDIRFDWEIGTPPAAPLTIQIDLLNRDGQSATSQIDQADTTYWERGRVSTRHSLIMPPLEPGVLDVYVTVSYRAARLGGYKAARLVIPIGSHPASQPPLATFAGGTFLQPTFEVQPDQIIVTLRWQSSGALDRDYKFFLHVEDSAGGIATQADAEPKAGSYPTSLWQSGDLIEDAIPLSLANVPPGDYTLQFGMYHESDRLAFSGCQSPQSLALAVIHIAPDRAISARSLECAHQ